MEVVYDAFFPGKENELEDEIDDVEGLDEPIGRGYEDWEGGEADEPE